MLGIVTALKFCVLVAELLPLLAYWVGRLSVELTMGARFRRKLAAGFAEG